MKLESRIMQASIFAFTIQTYDISVIGITLLILQDSNIIQKKENSILKYR